MPIVIDTSVVVKWVVTEVDGPRAYALRNDLFRVGEPILAPSLLVSELTNVLYGFVMGGHITAPAAETGIDDVLRYVEIQPLTSLLAKRSLALATITSQTHAYDVQFLALAEQIGCDLWTADGRFVRAVARHGFAQVKDLVTYPLPPPAT